MEALFRRVGQSTIAQFSKYSPQAEASFKRTYKHNILEHFMYVNRTIELDYLTLRERLDNLHSIIQLPEVYF